MDWPCKKSSFVEWHLEELVGSTKTPSTVAGFAYYSIGEKASTLALLMMASASSARGSTTMNLGPSDRMLSVASALTPPSVTVAKPVFYSDFFRSFDFKLR